MKVYRFLKNLGLCALVATCTLPAVGSQTAPAPVATPASKLASSTSIFVNYAGTSRPAETSKYNYATGQLMSENPTVTPSVEAIRARVKENEEKTKKIADFKQKAGRTFKFGAGLTAGGLVAASLLTGKSIPAQQKMAMTLFIAYLLHDNRNELFSPELLNKIDTYKNSFLQSTKVGLSYAVDKGQKASRVAFDYAKEQGPKAAQASWKFAKSAVSTLLDYTKKAGQSAKSSIEGYMANEPTETTKTDEPTETSD